MHNETMDDAVLNMQRDFPRELKAARRHQRFTQADVAKAIGISTEVYGRMERGYCGASMETLVRMSHFLGVSIDQLLGRSTTHPSTETVFVPNEEHRRLVRAIRLLSEKSTRAVLRMLQTFITK